MTKKTISIQDAEKQFHDLIIQASEGSEIIIRDGNKAIAKIIPVKNKYSPRVAGLHTGKIWSSEDFDAPVKDELLTPEKGDKSDEINS